MVLSLTAAAVGLLAGCAYCLAQRRELEPSTFPLLGLAVISLGETITAYFYPFAVGLLLGLVYDVLEDEWYGPAVARSARLSFRTRLFLKTVTADWSERHPGRRESVEGPAVCPGVEGVATMSSSLNVRIEERLAERTRIVQELHDTLLQGVLSASMQLHVAASRLAGESPAKPPLTKVLALMGRVFEEGRKAVRGWRSWARTTGRRR